MNKFQELTEWAQKANIAFMNKSKKFALMNAKVLLLFLLTIMYSCNKDTGFMDQYGKIGSLYPVLYGEKMGYINAKGEIKINPMFEFDDAIGSFFFNGLAVASTDGDDYGYIDEKGAFVISPQYDYANIFGTEGLAYVRNGDNSYFIDKKGMPTIMLSQYKGAGSFFNDGLTIVYDEDWDVGYIDTKGALAIPIIFDSGQYFSNGLAWVKRKGDAKYEAIDKTGNTIVMAMYDDARGFSEGLAAVRVGDYYGYVNAKGEYIISLQFDWADTFYDGLAVVEQNDKYGYINKKGEWVIMAQFDDALEFCGGFAAVEMKGKWGFIDKKGNWAVQPIYYDAYYFISDLGLVIYDEDDDGISYVDNKGSIVWKHSNMKSASLQQKEAKTREEKSEMRRMIFNQMGH